MLNYLILKDGIFFQCNLFIFNYLVWILFNYCFDTVSLNYLDILICDSLQTLGCCVLLSQEFLFD